MAVSSSFSINLPHNASLYDTSAVKTTVVSSSSVKCRVFNNSSFANCALRITSLDRFGRGGAARFVVKSVVPDEIRVLEEVQMPKVDLGGKVPPDNGGSGGGGDGGSGGGGGDGGGNEEDGEGMEFGPMMKLEDVMRESEKVGVNLPDDIIQAAKTTGIPQVLLMRYLELQGSVWPLGFLMRHFGWLRNRMLADPAFLFKVGTEKRGDDFWAEFELYLADLLVGIVVNVALVGMLAPYARIGQRSVPKGFLGGFSRACRDLPSSVFEAERPGCRFSVQQRMASFLYTGLLQGGVGFGCGIVGQGIANLIMTAKRNMRKSDDDIPVPPLLKSAALWGVFLAVSSNTRYQVINGLERLVEGSPLAKNIPPVAMAFTVGVRFANNVYGGMQFVDWARWSGCQ
ncbi:hypothetical protein RND81_09G107200 [Saponaria officinalis]|uniref:Uncharacterized protein n=1 Tax=Saponaria officinalis TaxID=3572 RepID=A0AAW1IL20_SAPOF